MGAYLGSFQRDGVLEPSWCKGLLAPREKSYWFMPEPKHEGNGQRHWMGSQKSAWMGSSVISHDGEGPELTQFGFILLFPLFIRVARLVKLLSKVSKDLMHF